MNRPVKRYDWYNKQVNGSINYQVVIFVTYVYKYGETFIVAFMRQ
ncbi:MAG TPA: hypothetical protein VFG54_11655 [Prolixibacteraceae bacterium]|nr:hypothetical protein [Prolixibacteraceae bacterium]